MADMVVFWLMIAGGIVFMGGISVVLLLLAFYVPKASQRKLEREDQAKS